MLSPRESPHRSGWNAPVGRSPTASRLRSARQLRAIGELPGRPGERPYLGKQQGKSARNINNYGDWSRAADWESAVGRLPNLAHTKRIAFLV
jgi:hypothetical protein